MRAAFLGIVVLASSSVFAVEIAPATRPASLSDLREEQRQTRELLLNVRKKLVSQQPSISREDRMVQLNNLKQKYQFRLRDLQTELRDKVVHLNIDGMNTSSGRIGAKELELEDALHEKFELGRAAKQTEHALAKTPDDAKLKDQHETQEKDLKELDERIASVKQELGELQYAMNQYLISKDEENTTRELLHQVQASLDRLSQDQSAEKSSDAVTMKLRETELMYERRLGELTEQIAKTQRDQLAAMFPDVMDVYVSQAELDAGKPSIAGATFAGTSELGERTLVRLSNSSGSWTIDPAKIVAMHGQK
jgi:hypothetical protein